MKKAFAKGYKAFSGGTKNRGNPYYFGSAQWHDWEKGFVSAYVDIDIDGKTGKRIPKSFN